MPAKIPSAIECLPRIDVAPDAEAKSASALSLARATSALFYHGGAASYSCVYAGSSQLAFFNEMPIYAITAVNTWTSPRLYYADYAEWPMWNVRSGVACLLRVATQERVEMTARLAYAEHPGRGSPTYGDASAATSAFSPASWGYWRYGVPGRAAKFYETTFDLLIPSVTVDNAAALFYPQLKIVNTRIPALDNGAEIYAYISSILLSETSAGLNGAA